MSITLDGWVSWAERVPGPADKRYTEANRGGRYIPHSAVGYYGGWASRLFSTERLADGRYTPYAAASVHFWIPQRPLPNGKRVIQHYPITVSCWASGNREANTNGIAAENEGGFMPVNEPLTEHQVQVNLDLIKEISQSKGWNPTRPPLGAIQDATLLEHNECIRLWGGSSTACPSSRIPWVRFLLELLPLLEDEMEIIGQFANNIPWTQSYLVFIASNGKVRKASVGSPEEYELLVAAGYPTKKYTKIESIPNA